MPYPLSIRNADPYARLRMKPASAANSVAERAVGVATPGFCFCSRSQIASRAGPSARPKS
jgi:hypothetical protein